jgi:potassium efflux system protein
MNMNISEIALFEWLGKFFGHISVEGLEKFLIQGTKAVLVLILSYLFLRLLLKFIDRYFKNDHAILTYKSICRYVVWTLGIFSALHVAGIELSVFFTTGGLIAVAAGFALKTLAENYVAGMVLRSEETVKRGDVLNLDGLMVRVKDIGLRSTIVRARDDSDIMIPNSLLVQGKIGNYTLRDSLCRVSTTIGVRYSSDLKKVREVLEGVCNKLEGLSSRHAPIVYLTDFGNSSVNDEVDVWIDDPWKSKLVRSALNEAIWWALKGAGIVIAFPQLDLHFDKNFGQPDGFNKQEPEH